MINKGITRFRLGNPPGKNKSYGDAIIWETLLQDFLNEKELHFVGLDKDFVSKLDKNKFSEYLLNEWKEKKKSKIIPYQYLGEFIKKEIPEISSPDKILKEEKEAEEKYL